MQKDIFQSSLSMTLLRLTQARDRTGQGQGSAFQTAILGHFQQLRELGQGLDLHLHVGGRVVSIHKVSDVGGGNAYRIKHRSLFVKLELRLGALHCIRR